MKKQVSRFAQMLFFALTVLSASLSGQEVVVVPRQDYYTTEKSAEILFYVKHPLQKSPLSGEIYREGKPLVRKDGLKKGMNRLATSLAGFHGGKNLLRCVVKDGAGNRVVDTSVFLTILPDKPNEVKMDRLTGTLLVDGLPFIPFGFYTYSPVYPTLPEEEVVKGFNLMSPYQKIDRKTLKQRKAYMDRCAALGMKVNYNLLSVAGEGGVRSKMNITQEEKRKRLIREVLAFRDHPALLSWYIADEPVGQGKPPEPLIETYKLIKKLDPYHPVTMVFMTPSQAWRYAGAMDIVMADPYPIPNHAVTVVEDVTRSLETAFYPEKLLWIVPQAFGGGENWKREPTPGELRVMTYLALINGARGIQYFIRNGLNGFPKSTAAWSECGKISLETAELTPYFAGGTETGPDSADSKNIRVKTFYKDSTLAVICVNTSNRPLAFKVKLPDSVPSGEAEVMFENRKAQVENALLSDMIGALGTRVYKVSLKKPQLPLTGEEKNMMADPGFEYLPVPGVPSATYAHVGKDRGSTYFVDARVFHSGGHSLRLVTPEEGKGVTLTFFPSYLKYDYTYRFALWAKAAPVQSYWEEKGFFWRLFHRKPLPPTFTVSAKGAGSKTFGLTNKWQQYEWLITLADSTKKISRTSVYLTLDSRGTAWFDDLYLAPVMSLKTSVSVPGESLEIQLFTSVHDGSIRYTLNGQKPGPSSRLYTAPILLRHDADLVAGLFRNGKRTGTYHQSFVIHKALGSVPVLKNPYSPRYTGGGPGGLTDGLLAQASYRDPHWQGFFGKDIEVTVDLDSVQDVRELAADFLQQTRWFRIFFPLEVNYYVSENGKDYTLVYHYAPEQPSRTDGPQVMTVKWQGKPVRARYIRMEAKNIGVAPSWSSGAGLKAWLFCDEIMVK